MMHGWGMGGFGMGPSFFGLFLLFVSAAGLFVLFRRWDRGRDGTRRNIIDRRNRPGTNGNRVTAPDIFRLARRYNGVVTVSDVVSELDVDPTDAEELLVGLTDGQRVDMEVDSDGVVRYVFREFIE